MSHRFRVAVLRVVVALAAVIMSVTCFRPAQAQGGQKWALVVGVDRYDHEEQIHPLRYAGADAVAVRQALIQYGGYPPDHVILMTSESGNAPSSANILGQLAGLQASVQAGDSFVFYFSGHGAERGADRFLLTSDTNPAATFTLEQTSLEVRKVRNIIEGLKASRILELVDACADNPWGGSRAAVAAKSTAGMARDLQLSVHRAGGDLDAAVTILSCKPGQRSYEGWHHHGYFTYYLVQGLEGAAAADGVVTVPSLVNYLAREVPAAVSLHEYGKKQEPDAHADGTGVFSWQLAAAEGGATHAPPAALAPPSAPVDELAGAPRAPTVRVSFPPAGYSTTASSVLVGALITGGGRVSDVSVDVNGQEVSLDAGALQKTAQGAVVKAEVPLKLGDNTILVTAVASSGEPGQTVVSVRRTALLPPTPATFQPSSNASSRPSGKKAASGKTIFDFKDQLGLTDQQVRDIHMEVDRLKALISSKDREKARASADLKQLIAAGADQSVIRARYDEIAKIQEDISIADIETSRRISSILTPQQLSQWHEIQRRSREHRP